MKALRVAIAMTALWWAVTASLVGAVRLTHAAEDAPRSGDHVELEGAGAPGRPRDAHRSTARSVDPIGVEAARRFRTRKASPTASAAMSAAIPSAPRTMST